MSYQEDLQRLLKREYLIGPEARMDIHKKGINYYSGNKSTAYYELWGEKEIFRLVIAKPSPSLFTTKFVGKNHLLMLLIVENDQMIGGFVSLQENMAEQFSGIFPHLNDESLQQLDALWANFVKDHYMYDLAM